MKQILLTRNKTAIVDDEDFTWLSQWKWHASGSEQSKFYAAHDVYIRYMKDKKRSLQKCVYMHKLIMKCPDGMEVDHINGNSLDNRKSNLRITSHKFNGYNLKRYKNNKSGYKGVYFNKPNNKWLAYIRVDKKLKRLGYFETPQEAVEAYNAASLKYHKDFGRINHAQ